MHACIRTRASGERNAHGIFCWKSVVTFPLFQRKNKRKRKRGREGGGGEREISQWEKGHKCEAGDEGGFPSFLIACHLYLLQSLAAKGRSAAVNHLWKKMASSRPIFLAAYIQFGILSISYVDSFSESQGQVCIYVQSYILYMYWRGMFGIICEHRLVSDARRQL